MKEYINKTVADLKALVAEKREAIRKIRFGNAGTASKNVREISNLKKEVARIETVITAKSKVVATESSK
jgi:ribosomal protein L29